MVVTGAHIRAARGLVGWSQSELAERAGIVRATVAAFEQGSGISRASVGAIVRALERVGVVVSGDETWIAVGIKRADLEQLQGEPADGGGT